MCPRCLPDRATVAPAPPRSPPASAGHHPSESAATTGPPPAPRAPDDSDSDRTLSPPSIVHSSPRSPPPPLIPANCSKRPPPQPPSNVKQRLHKRTSAIFLPSRHHILPTVRRDIGVDPSIMRQVDGLIVALFGRQARVDRDVLGDPGNAVASAFGMEPYDCVSSLFGIYIHELDVAWVSVATVAAFRGCGVFLVPIAHGSEPFLVPSTGAPPVSWFDYLLSKSALVLHVPKSCLRGRAAVSGSDDVMFVVTQFGVNGRIRLGPNLRRPERLFHLVSEGLRPMHLPVHPELLACPSPLADSLAPTIENDTAPASLPFVSPAGSSPPCPRWTKWQVAHIDISPRVQSSSRTRSSARWRWRSWTVPTTASSATRARPCSARSPRIRTSSLPSSWTSHVPPPSR